MYVTIFQAYLMVKSCSVGFIKAMKPEMPQTSNKMLETVAVILLSFTIKSLYIIELR